MNDEDPLISVNREDTLSNDAARSKSSSPNNGICYSLDKFGGLGPTHFNTGRNLPRNQTSTQPVANTLSNGKNYDIYSSDNQSKGDLPISIEMS